MIFFIFGRFEKCLRIGMKPNWVLSDEQCSIRFRKVRREEQVKVEEVLIKPEPSPVKQSKLLQSVRTSVSWCKCPV